MRDKLLDWRSTWLLNVALGWRHSFSDGHVLHLVLHSDLIAHLLSPQHLFLDFLLAILLVDLLLELFLHSPLLCLPLHCNDVLLVSASSKDVAVAL